MKKILIVVVALIILALLVMPIVTGGVAKSTTYELVARTAEKPLEYGRLKLPNYHRGLYSTQFNLSWSPHSGVAALLEEPLELDCIGKHGVLSYQYQCEPVNARSWANFVDAELDGVNPLQIIGRVNLFGKIHQQLKLHAFEISNDDGESLNVSSAVLSLDTDDKLSKINLDGKFEGLSAKGADGELTLGPLSLSGNVFFNQLRLGLGELDIQLKSMRLVTQTDSKGEIDISNLSAFSKAEERGDNLYIDYQMSIEEFTALDKSQEVRIKQGIFGLSDISASLVMDGIGMQQLAAIKQKFTEMEQGMSLQEAADDTAKNAKLLSMLPEFEKLIKPGLAIQAKASADYMSETMRAELAVELLNKLSLGDLIMLRINPQSVFAKFIAKLQLELPQQAFSNNPEVLSMLANSPWFVDTSDSYQSDLNMTGDEIKLNGQVLSADELLKVVSQSKN